MATDLSYIAPFLGQYQFENPRNQIAGFKDKLLISPELYTAGNSLFVKYFMEEKIRLVQTAHRRFAREGANAATVVFVQHANGRNIMVMDGAYFEQVPALKVKAKRWLSVIAVSFPVSAILAGLISLMVFITGRLRLSQLIIRVLPMLATLLLVWAVMNLLQVQTESYLLSELTEVNGRTIIIFSGTLLFAVFSVLHLLLVLGKFNQFSKKVYAFYWLVTALSLCYIAFVLFQNGWIGLRTWAM
jgi:hypothetical protein